jgi:hypothetical protein
MLFNPVFFVICRKPLPAMAVELWFFMRIIAFDLWYVVL